MSFLSRHLTKIGRIPDVIKSSMGGFLSLDSSFLRGNQILGSFFTCTNTGVVHLFLYLHLAACTALSWTTGFSLVAFCGDKTTGSIRIVSDISADNRRPERSKLLPLRWHQEYRFAAKRGADEILLVPVKCIIENTVFTLEFPAHENN